MAERMDPRDFPGGVEGCLEAVLAAADEPVDVPRLVSLLKVSPDEIEKGLEALEKSHPADGTRGWAVVRSARGWRLESSRAYDALVTAFLGQGSHGGTLSQAGLETLSIIAYKQPITRADVSQIRGVASDGIIRSLIVHGLVAQTRPSDGSQARNLVTTDLFLEKMGIGSLADLPALAPLLPSSEQAREQGERMSEDHLQGDDEAGDIPGMDAALRDFTGK